MVLYLQELDSQLDTTECLWVRYKSGYEKGKGYEYFFDQERIHNP